MTDAAPNNEKTRLEQWSPILIPALTGLLTLAGAMSASVAGWMTSSQTAEISIRQSCVARMDIQEQNLRAKADVFISALGNLMALTGYGHFEPDVYNSRLDDLMKAGYSFSVYSPPELSVLSTNLVTSLKNAFNEKDDAKSTEFLNSFNNRNQQWSDRFQELMKTLEAQRHRC
jgi:hypothetical protein